MPLRRDNLTLPEEILPEDFQVSNASGRLDRGVTQIIGLWHAMMFKPTVTGRNLWVAESDAYNRHETEIADYFNRTSLAGPYFVLPCAQNYRNTLSVVFFDVNDAKGFAREFRNYVSTPFRLG